MERTDGEYLARPLSTHIQQVIERARSRLGSLKLSASALAMPLAQCLQAISPSDLKCSHARTEAQSLKVSPAHMRKKPRRCRCACAVIPRPVYVSSYLKFPHARACAGCSVTAAPAQKPAPLFVIRGRTRGRRARAYGHRCTGRQVTASGARRLLVVSRRPGPLAGRLTPAQRHERAMERAFCRRRRQDCASGQGRSGAVRACGLCFCR